MSSSKVDIFADHIFRHSTYVEKMNLSFSQFFIKSSSGTLCIETGARADFSSMRATLLAQGIDVASVSGVIVPHFEDDEMGALPEFVALNKGVVAYAHPICSHALSDIFPVKAKPLKDETPITINDEVIVPIFVKHVHQWDALVIYVPRLKALFSSDIFMRFGPVDEDSKDPVAGMIASIERSEYLPSIEYFHRALIKIKKYDVESIFPMHGPAIHGNTAAVVDGLIDYCEKKLGKEVAVG
ncbi:beta-lactamase domain protein [Burkholderia sp. H160]|nr:beta-lactamase domain protein [Burkholderia sp. H160]